MDKNDLIKGGEFLVKETDAKNIFIPEEFNEEQMMIVQTCEDFLEAEVYPHLERIDSAEPGLMKELIEKAGELGLLGISVPEEYDGFDQSFLTSMKACEAMGGAHSFSVAYMAHIGIGTLPTLYYGNKEQKEKYIPRLATGELTAAYCLTEPNAGSDANSGKTKATLSEDGKYYILNGQKMWITNGGFADIQTVFAKIDNDRILSAFIVESKWDGITLNPEEKKMGIKGSSTRQIFYNDVKVPVENLLGRRGEGFRIALTILHNGRIKLGATVLGATRRAISHSVKYANERKQFGSLISNFGAIKFKLAEQVIKSFTAESAVYRASKDVQDAIDLYISQGKDKEKANIEGVSRFVVECALLKVYASEAQDYIVDEAVQIHGGLGYSADMPVDRAYRDSRINRIFEGTNEINRILIVDTALKAAKKGEFDLFGIAKNLKDNIENIYKEKTDNEDWYSEKKRYIKNFKNATLILIDSISECFEKYLIYEQEILFNISDMMMYIYAAESTLLRVEKLKGIKREDKIGIYKDIVDVFVYDTSNNILKSGIDAISSFAEGEEQKKLGDAIFKLSKVATVNIKEARRRIADKLIDDNK